MLLRRPSLLVRACLGLLALYLLIPAGGTPADDAVTDEKVTQYLNLGKAFYENPTTQAEAVVEFKKALDLRPNSVREQLNYGLALLRAARTTEAIAVLEKVQKEDPSLPHTWFNLGIYYKRDGQFDKAIEQFRQLAKLAPNEAITHYNLGTIYKLQGKMSDAQREFELARDLNPALSAPHFQLFNIYRQQKRTEEANRELALFKERKTAQDSIATPEDVEWCEFAEIYEPLKPEPDTSKQLAEFAFTPTVLGEVKPGPSGLVTLDAYGSGKPDLLVYSVDGITILSGRCAEGHRYRPGRPKRRYRGCSGRLQQRWPNRPLYSY